MKKTILFIAICLCVLTEVHAQRNHFKGLHVGLATACNSVWIFNQNMYGARELEYKPKIGVMYGLAAGYEFKSHLGVQIELSRTSQGQDYKDIVNGKKVNRQVNLSYIQIPIILKYGGSGNNSRFYAMGGIQFGFLSSSSIYQNSKQVYSKDLNKNANGFFVRKDFGIKMGMGDDILISKNMYLNIGLQGFYGLTDINAEVFRRDYKDRPYEKSINAYGGIEVGFHYFIR
jgi:hypothetical protein